MSKCHVFYTFQGNMGLISLVQHVEIFFQYVGYLFYGHVLNTCFKATWVCFVPVKGGLEEIPFARVFGVEKVEELKDEFLVDMTFHE